MDRYFDKILLVDVGLAEGMKPYPNEHACRLRDPDDFQSDSFARQSRDHEGKEYHVIMGRLKGEDSLTEQAYRYNKEIWTEGEAQKHCDDHDGISFEAASDKAQSTDKAKQFEFHAEIQKKTMANDNLIIEGWASTRDLDRDIEVVEPGAIASGIDAFMKNPILLYMHDIYNPIGKILNLSIKPIEGFWIKAMLSKAEDVKDVVIKIQEGIIKAFSIGFRELDGKLLEDIWHIIALELYEVSVVSIPSNREALFNVAKGFQWGSDVVVPMSQLVADVEKIKSRLGIPAISTDLNIQQQAGEANPVNEIEYINFLAELQKVRCLLRQGNKSSANRQFDDVHDNLKNLLERK